MFLICVVCIVDRSRSMDDCVTASTADRLAWLLQATCIAPLYLSFALHSEFRWSAVSCLQGLPGHI